MCFWTTGTEPRILWLKIWSGLQNMFLFVPGLCLSVANVQLLLLDHLLDSSLGETLFSRDKDIAIWIYLPFSQILKNGLQKFVEKLLLQRALFSNSWDCTLYWKRREKSHTLLTYQVFQTGHCVLRCTASENLWIEMFRNHYLICAKYWYLICSG